MKYAFTLLSVALLFLGAGTSMLNAMDGKEKVPSSAPASPDEASKIRARRLAGLRAPDAAPSDIVSPVASSPDEAAKNRARRLAELRARDAAPSDIVAPVASSPDEASKIRARRLAELRAKDAAPSGMESEDAATARRARILAGSRELRGEAALLPAASTTLALSETGQAKGAEGDRSPSQLAVQPDSAARIDGMLQAVKDPTFWKAVDANLEAAAVSDTAFAIEVALRQGLVPVVGIFKIVETLNASLEKNRPTREYMSAVGIGTLTQVFLLYAIYSVNSYILSRPEMSPYIYNILTGVIVTYIVMKMGVLPKAKKVRVVEVEQRSPAGLSVADAAARNASEIRAREATEPVEPLKLLTAREVVEDLAGGLDKMQALVNGALVKRENADKAAGALLTPTK